MQMFLSILRASWSSLLSGLLSVCLPACPSCHLSVHISVWYSHGSSMWLLPLFEALWIRSTLHDTDIRYLCLHCCLFHGVFENNVLWIHTHTPRSVNSLSTLQDSLSQTFLYLKLILQKPSSVIFTLPGYKKTRNWKCFLSGSYLK